MSDGAIILLAFAVILGVPLVIVFTVLGISKKRQKQKYEKYKGHTNGVVLKIVDKGMDYPFVIYVQYEVGGRRYEIHESAKLKSETIRIGKIPVGQRKTFVLGPTQAGDTLEILYDESNPQKAMIKGNDGVITG